MTFLPLPRQARANQVKQFTCQVEIGFHSGEDPELMEIFRTDER
jgi:hypothetical protein